MEGLETLMAAEAVIVKGKMPRNKNEERVHITDVMEKDGFIPKTIITTDTDRIVGAGNIPLGQHYSNHHKFAESSSNLQSFAAEKGYRNYGGVRWDKITRIRVNDEKEDLGNGMNRTQSLKNIPSNSEVKKWLRVKRTKELPGNANHEYYYYWGLRNPAYGNKNGAESFAADARELYGTDPKELLELAKNEGLECVYCEGSSFHDPFATPYSKATGGATIYYPCDCGETQVVITDKKWGAESFAAEQKFRHKKTGEIATQISLMDIKNWEKLEAESFSADNIITCEECGTTKGVKTYNSGYVGIMWTHCDKCRYGVVHDRKEREKESSYNYLMDLREEMNEEDYDAESLKRDSCCCGATKSNPCACMIQGVMECSATCPCSLEN